MATYIYFFFFLQNNLDRTYQRHPRSSVDRYPRLIRLIDTLDRPSINTPSTPRLTLDRYSIDMHMSVDSWSAVDKFSIDAYESGDTRETMSDCWSSDNRGCLAFVRMNQLERPLNTDKTDNSFPVIVLALWETGNWKGGSLQFPNGFSGNVCFIWLSTKFPDFFVKW